MTVTPEQYGQLVQQLHDSTDLVRAQIAALLGELRAERSALTDEFVSQETNSDGIIQYTSRSTTNAFLMEGLVCIVPAGTTSALLEIGEIKLPVQNTFLQLDHLRRLVLPQDRRRLTVAPAVTNPDVCVIWLYGRELPLTQF